MYQDLYSSILEHLRFYRIKKDYAPFTYIGYGDDDELITFDDTLSFCENRGIDASNFRGKDICITFFVKDPDKNVNTAMIGDEFCIYRMKDGIEYFFPFQKAEDGADKCLAVLHNVFSIKDDESILVRTVIGGRYYTTDELPLEPRNTRYTNSNDKKSRHTRKWTPGAIAFSALFIAVFLAVGFMAIHDFIYRPLSSALSSYKVLNDSTVDVSNMNTWNVRENEISDLPESEGVYIWCLRSGAELTNNLLPIVSIGLPPCHCVMRNGEQLKVIYVSDGLNLKREIRNDIFGPSQSQLRAALGVMALKEPLPVAKPPKRSKYSNYYREFNDADELEISKWMTDQLYLFYTTTTVHGKRKELCDILQPILNLSLQRCETDNSDFYWFMNRAVHVDNLKKLTDDYKWYGVDRVYKIN